jgi:hypothetical protein
MRVLSTGRAAADPAADAVVTLIEESDDRCEARLQAAAQ